MTRRPVGKNNHVISVIVGGFGVRRSSAPHDFAFPHSPYSVTARRMRALFRLLLPVLLFVGLANGVLAHGLELSEFGGVTAATQWLHADGDNDQVPADTDKDSPHHHSICHGHEVGAAFRSCDMPRALTLTIALKPGKDQPLSAGPAARDLRPPIA